MNQGPVTDKEAAAKMMAESYGQANALAKQLSEIFIKNGPSPMTSAFALILLDQWIFQYSPDWKRIKITAGNAFISIDAAIKEEANEKRIIT